MKFVPFISVLLVASTAFSPAASPTRLQDPVKQVAPKSIPPASDDVIRAHPGPWGDIEWTVAYLEAPDSVLETQRKPDPNPHWIFPASNETAVRALFNRAGLPADMQDRLFDPKRMLTQEGNLELFPSVPDIQAIKPEAREIIYTELAKSPLNDFHHEPLVIVGPLEDWLRDSQLRPELKDQIRKLSYRNGRTLAFSDIRLLLTMAQSDAEVNQIFKTVTRTKTLFGQLKISPGSNARQLLEYWTGGRANSDITAILESATQHAGGMNLDITHILPPLARRRLYTFPTQDLLTRGRLPDCHWTSLNFFNSLPQDYYLDMRLAANRLLETYTPVDSPYHFGDMLCLLNDSGEAIHSCIYIADDVVFTKNGENGLRPWILQPLQEVRDFYGHEASGLKGFRRKMPSPI